MKKNNKNNLIRNVLVILPFIILAVIALIKLVQSNKPINYSVKTKIMMDTLVSVKTYGDKKVREEALTKAFEAMQEVENIASFHINDSELTKLNKDRRIKISSKLSDILQKALEAYSATNFYFDPTFALLQKAYGFYDNKPHLPGKEELIDILGKIGLANQLKKSGQNWSLASGSLIDLGGIAGGFAMEKAIAAIRAASCTAFFIDDAGDLWMEGHKPDSTPWKVAVRDPRDNSYLALIESYGPVAISTSGDYERYITVDGKKYGHIMDPQTGIPADFYRSVTVIASSPIEADTFSTAVFAMSLDKAIDWTEQHNVPALLLTASGQVVLNNPGKSWFKAVKNE